MKIAIFGRPGQYNNSSFIDQLFDVFQKYQIEYTIYKPFVKSLALDSFTKNDQQTYTSNQDIPKDTHFILSIGGDGTFLDAVKIIQDLPIPILGFNTGRLGFLSSVAIDNFEESIIKLISGEYSIKERALLSCNYPGFSQQNTGLNDFTIHKKDSSSMITIHTWLNDEFVNSYWADGLIISTPTGSTAYSLSCGGPIIDPDTESFIITPIAPHNLTVRPMVVSNLSKIKIKPEGRTNSFLISLDGNTASIESDVEIVICIAPYKIKMVLLHGDSFYSTLRNKLMWGIDKRN